MNALVVDDERPAREELQWLIDQCEGVQVVAEADSAESARSRLEDHADLDVVFLDIDMPGLDGIRVAEWLDGKPDDPAVVFVTAYEEYAVDAFELDAVDYLLKPVRLERLREALERIGPPRKEAAAKPDASEETLHRLSVETDDGLRVIDADEVLKFETEASGVVAVTATGTYATDFSLAALEDLLTDADFFRSHRSCIVRLDAIRRIVPDGSGTYRLHLVADDSQTATAPLARSRTDELKTRIPSSDRVFES